MEICGKRHVRCFNIETAVSGNVCVNGSKGQAVGEECFTHSFVPLACAEQDDSLPF